MALAPPAALSPAQRRRAERARTERTLLHAIAIAAERLVENVPGATWGTLEITITAWRAWERRARRRA
jgi:hypothetical protein